MSRGSAARRNAHRLFVTTPTSTWPVTRRGKEKSRLHPSALFDDLYDHFLTSPTKDFALHW